MDYKIPVNIIGQYRCKEMMIATIAAFHKAESFDTCLKWICAKFGYKTQGGSYYTVQAFRGPLDMLKKRKAITLDKDPFGIKVNEPFTVWPNWNHELFRPDDDEKCITVTEQDVWQIANMDNYQKELLFSVLLIARIRKNIKLEKAIVLGKLLTNDNFSIKQYYEYHEILDKAKLI